MKILNNRISVSTKGNEDFLNITQQLNSIFTESGLDNGIVTLFVSGSTAKLFSHICFAPKWKEKESVLTIQWYILF